MRYLSIEDAKKAHDEIIRFTGGLEGFNKNIGFLESALVAIRNDAWYPTLNDKLTHLMYSCIQFHPFLDGNKRTSIFLGMHFLKMNKKKINGFAFCMEDVVVRVASGEISKDELKKILKPFTA